MSAPPAGMAASTILLMMFVAGIGIPLMATLNAGLGQHVGSPAATAILFGGGLLLSGIVLMLTGLPPAHAFAGVTPYSYLGAVLVVFYILSITFAAPRVGVGNAVFFVLLGQLVAAAAIDHFGLLGALHSALTVKRAIGIAVMAAGVYLARKPT